MAKPLKRCSCGASYSKKEWETLQYVGKQVTEDDNHVFTLELRNCSKCLSTIGIEVITTK